MREAANGSVIEMRDVSKTWGEVGVHNITLQVPAGQIFGVVGPSGCGKTTTIRMLTGVYSPDSGELRVLGSRPRVRCSTPGGAVLDTGRVKLARRHAS